jgi:2-methylisocitrate lyase-like PEP mutase family enzyme
VTLGLAAAPSLAEDGAMDAAQLRERFRTLHEAGTFVMPNPHDLGSLRLLVSLGFPAVATTSHGFASSLGRPDMAVRRDELVAHVDALSAASTVPLNVDSERCFPEDDGGVAETVRRLAAAGAAGCSIEDWNPRDSRLEPLSVATEAVAQAASAAKESGLVLTARAENHLRGNPDLDDTIARLRAYREAGADAVYAPGLIDLRDIVRVVESVDAPLNVLALPGGPSTDELAGVGVRRISVGSLLSSIAYGALYRAAKRLAADGVIAPDEPFLGSDGAAAFVA